MYGEDEIWRRHVNWLTSPSALSEIKEEAQDLFKEKKMKANLTMAFCPPQPMTFLWSLPAVMDVSLVRRSEYVSSKQVTSLPQALRFASTSFL